MRIRVATPDDGESIARIQVGAWRAAYRGIVPDAILDELDPDARAATWRDRIAALDPATVAIRVAVSSDGVVGYCSSGPARDDDAGPTTGEVWAIYVAPAAWRHGAGRALLDAAERWLAGSGYRDALLWVLRDNASARDFYEHCGWQADGCVRDIDIGGGPLPEVRYRRTLPSCAGAS